MMAPHLPGPWSSSLDALISTSRQRGREREKDMENCTGGFRSRLGSDSRHFLCLFPFVPNSVKWTFLNARGAGKCSLCVCPGGKHMSPVNTEILSASNLPTNQVLPAYVSTTGYEISYFFISSIIKRHAFCSDFSWFVCGFVVSLHLVLSLEIISLRSGPCPQESQDSALLSTFRRAACHPCPLGLWLNQTQVCSPESTYWHQVVVKGVQCSSQGTKQDV